MAVKAYKKLPGHGSHLASRSYLYLGPDHLLKVSASGGAEEYRRFYYSDIQAVLIRRTVSYVWILAIAVCLAAVFLTPGFIVAAGSGLGAAAIAWFIPGGIAALTFFANLILGPTCKTVLQTAAHKEPLPSLRRTRTAAKTLKSLIPLIDSAQAEIALDGVVVSNESTPPDQPSAEELDTSLAQQERHNVTETL